MKNNYIMRREYVKSKRYDFVGCKSILFFMRDTRIQRNICEFNADSSYSIVIQIQ